MATVLVATGESFGGDGKQFTKHSRPVIAGSSIASGDLIRTSRNAAAALSLVPGVFIEAGGETDLSIERLRVVKHGSAMVNAMKSRTAVVRLGNGVVRASLRELGSGRCELEVKTKQGTVLARSGAIFSARANAEFVRVICIRGETSWEDLQGVAGDLIPAGYFRDYIPGGVNTLRAASEDAEVEGEVVSALDTANYLESVALQARNAPFPWRHR